MGKEDYEVILFMMIMLIVGDYLAGWEETESAEDVIIESAYDCGYLEKAECKQVLTKKGE